MKTKKIEILFFLFSRLKHRGPDWSGLHCHGDCYLAHQRLAIVDPASGDQPLYNQDKTVVVTVCCLFSSLSLSLFIFFMPISSVVFLSNLVSIRAFNN